MPRAPQPPSAPPPSHDTASKMVASVLTDIEARLGEQQGWDVPPRLFMLSLRPRAWRWSSSRRLSGTQWASTPPTR